MVAFSLIFMTGRAEPKLEWTLEGIAAQQHPNDEIDLVIVDVFGRPWQALAGSGDLSKLPTSVVEIRSTMPKPNVWQGPHRVTDRDWWATANARNTGIVLARTDYLVFLDDRAHLGPDWFAAVRTAAAQRASVVAGTYDKLEGPPEARKTARDHRRELFPAGKLNCGGGWLYGCTLALPLAWALEVNGFEEGCDGLTGEDYIFGLMLGNTGKRIDFSSKLAVLQDRAVGNESCKGSYACRDKGTSPHDKSHAALERFGTRKRTEFTPDLTALRRSTAAGEPWPVPARDPAPVDWYDGQPIAEMQPPP